MFRPIVIHWGLTTKQWQQQSTGTQTNRYAHGNTQNLAQSPGALQTSKIQDRNIINVCTQATTGGENTLIDKDYCCFMTLYNQYSNCHLSYAI
jgi:hypothetical protein